MPYRYLRDNEYVTRATALGARTVEGIRCRMSAMLLHDLAHANDFFSASRVAAMNPALSVLHVVVSGTIHSRLLANESRLQPQMMLGLVRVSFYGATATSVQEAHAPENVVGEFPLDQASDYYGHATTCEDYAMLFEETLMLDRFDIDYALCMYCGICVEVCPFDALFWTPEYEYSEPRIADLLHDKDRLGEWMETVPDFLDYEAGSEQKVRKVPR